MLKNTTRTLAALEQNYNGLLPDTCLMRGLRHQAKVKLKPTDYRIPKELSTL